MLDHTSQQFQQISANQLSFRVTTARSGDRLVLCLHGCPESAVFWRHQIAPLARAGFRIWDPDLRGYGGRTRPTSLAPYRIETLLDDVATLLDAAKARRAILVGHGWGGIIVWYYAMRQPARVGALVLLNAPHPAWFEHEVRHWRQLRRSWYMLCLKSPGFRKPSQLPVARASSTVPSNTCECILNIYRTTSCASTGNRPVKRAPSPHW